MIARLQDVSKNYGRKEGIRKLSFDLTEGEVLGVLGLNGAGKTTLLKVMAGLLFPTEGSLTVLGKAPRQARNDVVYISDEVNFFSWMDPPRVKEVFGPILPGFDSKRFDHLVEFLEVPAVGPREMSKGQRNRLLLATMLARSASIYLLDEPLSGIDILSREKILKALISERPANSTILLSTHEVAEAEGLFTRAIFLKDGALVKDQSFGSGSPKVLDVFREVLA